MKLEHILLVGLGVIALTSFSKAQGTDSGTSPTTPTSNQPTKPTDLGTGMIIEAITGKTEDKSTAIGRLQNLLSTHDQGSITATNDPLMYRIEEIGGGHHYASVAGGSTTPEVVKASRKDNAQQIARLDPSYKNTIAYQKIMSS